MTARLGPVSPLLAAMAWTLATIVEGQPGTPTSRFLIGIGLIMPATVAVVGMVVVRGRWAYRLGWVVLAATGALAVTVEVSPVWIVATTTSVLAGLVMVAAGAQIRKLPSATGPPDKAVLVPLLLIGAPFLLGIADVRPGWAALLVGISALAAALLYSRVIFGGLLLVRLIWPATALVVSMFMAWPGWLLTAALAVTTAVLARDPAVKTAFHPPREVGSTFPIPPELTPKDILDAARLDDRGRSR